MYFDTEVRVRYSETDQMGIVYHSNYFPWFEEARTGFFETMGLSYRELEEQGYFLPLIECNCKFIAPAKYADRLIIRARLREMKGIKMTLAYEAFRKADNMLLATGWTSHAFVNREMRPVKMPANVRSLLQGCLESPSVD